MEKPLVLINSLQPVTHPAPVNSLQQRAPYQVYRAQCMIPYSTFSIKVVYLITFMAFKIYVKVQMYWIPMVYPQAFSVSEDEEIANMGHLPKQSSAIPIAEFFFDGPIWSGMQDGSGGFEDIRQRQKKKHENRKKEGSEMEPQL